MRFRDPRVLIGGKQVFTILIIMNALSHFLRMGRLKNTHPRIGWRENFQGPQLSFLTIQPDIHDA